MRFDEETLFKALEFVAKGNHIDDFQKLVSSPVVKPVEKPLENTAAITPLAVATELCKRFEGLFLTPYLCPAGIPTIGYGATYYKDGSRVTLKDPALTHDEAHDLLLHMVKNDFLPKVIKLCPNIDTPERAAALIDFTYNLGVGRLKSSTLRKRVNDGRWDDAKSELMKWTIGGGRVLKGLVKRRQAEIDLI